MALDSGVLRRIVLAEDVSVIDFGLGDSKNSKTAVTKGWVVQQLCTKRRGTLTNSIRSTDVSDYRGYLNTNTKRSPVEPTATSSSTCRLPAGGSYIRECYLVYGLADACERDEDERRL